MAFLRDGKDWLHPIYACLRRRGRRLWHGWSEGGQHAWIEAARRDHPTADRMELFLPQRRIPLAGPGPSPRRWGGVFGVEVCHGGRYARMAPSHMIAANHSWDRALAQCRAMLAPDPAGGDAHRLEGPTVLLPLDGSAAPCTWHRSGHPVAIAAVTDEWVRALAHRLGGWLLAQTAPDGRLAYKYWPSRGAESAANNSVRQFMGTLALGRFARWTGDPEALAAAERNLDYQLRTFYRAQPDGSAVIEHGGSAKLGAAAIAGLALLEAPSTPERADALGRLARGIELLWRPSGAFRTFHHPPDRNDNQNFYPGEAALFWAHLYARERDPVVLTRLLRTLDHYRDWHRANRNPAFIPWHVQAHAALYDATGLDQRVPFIFEMVDWLLPMQQWETAPDEDMRGRFWDPARPDFGPPHAASTGAYLEGLAAAIGVARAVGENKRAKLYEQAFRRGLRSIGQLTYGDEMDFFYISRRNRVNGGVRTEVYDNTIRVDNVQHPLMAILGMIPSKRAAPVLGRPPAET
ncbi:hypothetical protein EDC65_1113 [Stella humosa]|uniref:Uncharacterized protein n=1 Tax=Stella humosa TaxID=94 RepID=A0A3N1MLQ6_9PROT|nr:hypothetical protein [Stella humosa]ROQ01926.1 hypothetical protein EDC65_1113 [Stella humosa]BBK32315.1 hypothetical protein STHU_29490 [Stella humosa]